MYFCNLMPEIATDITKLCCVMQYMKIRQRGVPFQKSKNFRRIVFHRAASLLLSRLILMEFLNFGCKSCQPILKFKSCLSSIFPSCSCPHLSGFIAILKEDDMRRRRERRQINMNRTVINSSFNKRFLQIKLRCACRFHNCIHP